MKKNVSIVYMGTPEFAVAPLKKLVDSGYKIKAVITAPDKPAGRGKKLAAPAVKKFAEKHTIPVLQPPKLKDQDFLEELKALKPEVQVVVAFRMLPKEVWSIPNLGTFNLHASLLPQYRGAAPINHAIINGETETGLTTFFIDEKIDTGEIIFQEKMSIGPEETAGELHDRMMEEGANLVLKTVDAIIERKAVTHSQQENMKEGWELKNAPKIFREDCRLTLNDPLESLFNKVRGLSPYPAAFAFLENSSGKQIQVKIFRTDFEVIKHSESPGTLMSDGKNFLKIAHREGFLIVKELQLAGKKRMDTKSFLIGFQDLKDWKLI